MNAPSWCTWDFDELWCVASHAGKAGALTARVLGISARLPDPVAVTFYDDPIQLVGGAGSEAEQSCPDVTPPDAAPTVFAARDNPSLYHLLRCWLDCRTLASAHIASADDALTESRSSMHTVALAVAHSPSPLPVQSAAAAHFPGAA